METKIDHSELENLLLRELLMDIPSEIDSLSTHSGIDSVYIDDGFESEVQDDIAYVKGTGTVSVTLHYGSEREDDAFDSGACFPLKFSLKLDLEDGKMEIIEDDLNDIKIDTSSFS